jgi:hypothetical protein
MERSPDDGDHALPVLKLDLRPEARTHGPHALFQQGDLRPFCKANLEAFDCDRIQSDSPHLRPIKIEHE